MRQWKVMVVSVAETKDRLVDHFHALFADKQELRNRMATGEPLPHIGSTSNEELAELALEDDLFREEQEGSADLVLMCSDCSNMFYRVSDPEKDDLESP